MSNRIKHVENITQRGTEIISEAEVKAWLKVDYTADDAVINAITLAALDWAEKKTDTSLGLRKLRVILTHDGQWPIRLPQGPIYDITKVEYRECHLVDYSTVTTEENDSWEQIGDTFISEKGTYKIEYIAGYQTLEPQLKLAVLNQISYLYEHRGDEERQYVAGGFGESETALNLIKAYIQNKII